MSEPKYREWILETIDSLRSRKARPDLERICRMVRRRHGSDPDRTRTELEKLIQDQTVLKVSYKGSISYRNAAKVQRKSRKKTSEFTAAGNSSSSSAEAVARERTKHNNLNNNGDNSAHSFTDQEGGEEEDSSPSPDPRPQTPASISGKKLNLSPSSSPCSGNIVLGCGATAGCAAAAAAAGSGCGGEEKASACREQGLGGHRQAGDDDCCDCPSPGHGGGGDRTSAHDSVDADETTATPSRGVGDADAIRGGMEPGLSGAKESDSGGTAADAEGKTCLGSESNNNVAPQRQNKQPVKPKVRVGGGGGGQCTTRTAGGQQANSDLGDRLVASVRRLSAATRGQAKPLGLKEILGYLSSQERLSGEKLTRGKVKVVLEREVARGRLRRSRCGNITLPQRGMVVPVEEEPCTHKNASAGRLLKSALQDRHVVKKESEPMETDSGEEDQEDNEEEEEDDPQSCDEEGGRAPVTMTTQPGLGNEGTDDPAIQTTSKQGSPQHQHLYDEGVAGLGPLTRPVCPPAQGALVPHCQVTQPERSTITTDQLHREIQDNLECKGRSHTSSGFNSVQCKAEVGVSSCLLTPTASPRDSGPAEERGMNGEVNRGILVKCEVGSVNPVDWTVSDVVSYFTVAGFPEQAVAFRTQEIDGKSLLLMQRNDVLTGLSIRLGPALKIYERHVKVLQKTHFDDDS